MEISKEIRSLIATGPLAHLTTLNADGSPQVSVVWVGIDGDEFVCGHMGMWQKLKNVRRDPRQARSLWRNWTMVPAPLSEHRAQVLCQFLRGAETRRCG